MIHPVSLALMVFAFLGALSTFSSGAEGQQLGFAAQENLETPSVADLIVMGGPIYTGDDAAPRAEAVAIAGGRFLFVGNLADTYSFQGPDTRIIDLKGAALYPGFVDAHAHLIGIGERELTLNLEGTNTLQDFQAKLKDWAEARPDDPMIMGRGWIETFWAEGRFPSRWDLDAIVPDRPVLLIRADGHALVANSLALEISGVTGDTPAPYGGDILVNALNEPTGMLIDAAMGLVRNLQPRMSDRRRREALSLGARVYADYGWTGLHNMSVSMADVEVLEDLATEGTLPIHVYNSINSEEAGPLLENGARTAGDGTVITRAIKLYMDGALGSRGAALLARYSDAETEGLLLIEKERATGIMSAALRTGIQINSHAIGDRANRLLLDWYEEVFKGLAPISRPVADPRWRVEHAQVVSAPDIPRFAQLGVIASMQPSHAISDLHFAPKRLGENRLDGAYAWRSLLDSGAIIAAGSDAPVERGDPLIEFYAAVERRDLKGYRGADWRPDQRVGRMEALRMFTSAAAYAAFMEDERGTITVGKRADLTGFADDIMVIDAEEIPKSKPVLTVVDGIVVFDNLAGDDTDGNPLPSAEPNEPFADDQDVTID